MDIVFTKKGTLGQTGLVPNDTVFDQYLLSSNQVKLTVEPGVADPLYVYYYVSSPSSIERILRDSEATGVPKTNVTYLRDFPIALPPLPEQRAIGRILGALDDKVKLQQRTSETLEAIARTLFKSWFVDFDPVRAKAEGRDPCLPQPLADLFPDRLVASEMGELPKGWKVGGLGDVLVQNIDRCSPSVETHLRPYVPIQCIAARSLLLAESKPGVEAQSSLVRFRKGDLLFGAMRPYFHKVAIAPFDGTTRTTVFVLRPRQVDDFSYATLLLHDAKTIEYATNHSTGSTIPYAVWEGSLERMPVVLAPAAIRRSFDRIARPLLDRIPPMFFANRTLTALRDVLLPQLVSGDLRLRDPDRILGNVD